VASVVDLENVFLEECVVKRAAQAFASGQAARLDVTLGAIEMGRVEDEELLSVAIPFWLKACDGEDTATESPDVEIRCRFVVLYRVSSFDGITDENCTLSPRQVASSRSGRTGASSSSP
jgi:hypothetical protein